MEVSQLILNLAGHHELLLAELRQIDSDRADLIDLAKRYPDAKSLLSAPHKDLGALKQSKANLAKELSMHLQCYELHRAAGEKLLKKATAAAASGIRANDEGASVRQEGRRRDVRQTASSTSTTSAEPTRQSGSVKHRVLGIPPVASSGRSFQMASSLGLDASSVAPPSSFSASSRHTNAVSEASELRRQAPSPTPPEDFSVTSTNGNDSLQFLAGGVETIAAATALAARHPYDGVSHARVHDMEQQHRQKRDEGGVEATKIATSSIMGSLPAALRPAVHDHQIGFSAQVQKPPTTPHWSAATLRASYLGPGGQRLEDFVPSQ